MTIFSLILVISLFELLVQMTRFVSLQAYKPLRTFVALVGLEIWSNSDQITVTPPAGANLDAFMKWRNSVLVKRTKHDNAHLIRYEQRSAINSSICATNSTTLQRRSIIR